ncbi:hypothetical protein VTK56DRAFT_8731 [Thermocarpiscus australiensis]
MSTNPIPLHPRPLRQPANHPRQTPNPLPPLLQTPSGLALLELQGTINLPPVPISDGHPGIVSSIPIGSLHFPDYRPAADDGDEGKKGGDAWMKRVYMYVGEHQRLQGEVRKLPRAVAVVRRRRRRGGIADDRERGGEGDEEGELEVVEVVKYKVVFSQRPEPITSSVG